MNKNNALALYSEVSVDARELTDAELMQIQGGGGNFHHNTRGHQFQRDCDDQRFGQGHYGWKLQGDCDDRRFRPNYQSWGFQEGCTPWNNCK